MREDVVTVAEAAEDFMAVLKHVESTGRAASVTREGKVIAQIIPVSEPASSSVDDLIRKWAGLERLPREEADSFANDLEKIHAQQPPLKSAWD